MIPRHEYKFYYKLYFSLQTTNDPTNIVNCTRT